MPCRTGTFAYQHTPPGALRENSRLGQPAPTRATTPPDCGTRRHLARPWPPAHQPRLGKGGNVCLNGSYEEDPPLRMALGEVADVASP
jgi:hypothetical protein